VCGGGGGGGETGSTAKSSVDIVSEAIINVSSPLSWFDGGYHRVWIPGLQKTNLYFLFTVQVSVGEAAAEKMEKVHGMGYTVGTSPQILCETRLTFVPLLNTAVIFTSSDLHSL